jgi:hypothetical protein
MANRLAKVELSKKTPAGEKRKRLPIMGIFEGRFEGSYDVSFSVPASDGNGYKKIVSITDEDGNVVDVSDCFVNLVVYEPLVARPPREGAPSKPSGEFKRDF